MISITLIQLLIYILLTILIIKRFKDIFAPGFIVMLKAIVCECIYGFVLISNLQLQSNSLFSRLSLPFDAAYAKALLINTISYIMMYFGVKLCGNRKNKYYFKSKITEQSKFLLRSQVIFLISFVMAIYFFYKVGGIVFYLSHIGTRQVIASGLGYLDFAFMLSLFICILLYFKLRYRTSIAINVLVFGEIIISCIMIFLYGGRNPIFILVLCAFGVFNYCYKKIDINFILKPKVLIICVFVLLSFIVLPAIRSDNIVDRVKKDGIINGIVNSVADASTSSLMAANTLDRTIFIYDYYADIDNLWLGKAYLDIIPSFIPRTLYPDKPPMDDGLYLQATINSGHNYVPSMSSDDIPTKSSTPLAYAAGYVNFGLLGQFISMFLLGWIVRKFYNIVNNERSIWNVFIYIIVMIKLGWSCLNIDAVIMNCGQILLVGFFLFKVRCYKKQKNV